MTYPELRAAIQQYSQDYEATFVENVDTFIKLAEARILLAVKLPRFRKDVTAAMSLGSNLLTVPTDFLAPDSFSIMTSSGLVFPVNKDPEFIDECFPDPSFLQTPRFYAMLNETTLKFVATPDQAYPCNLAYFYQPPSIVTAGYTWLGDHFPHALLSGSLVEAQKYMKGEDNFFARYLQAFQSDLQQDIEYAKGKTRKDLYQEPDARVQV
jgi:hypothetical protein